ncbi:hypothetical protein AAGS39_29160 [Flavobacterium sp. CGRL2]
MEEEIQIEDGLTLIRFQNDSSESFSAQHEIGAGLIQFHFALKGNAFFFVQSGSLHIRIERGKITDFVQSAASVIA